MKEIITTKELAEKFIIYISRFNYIRTEKIKMLVNKNKELNGWK